MRVYVAGPISGLPGFNYKAFREASAAWRAEGHDVLDPTERFGGRTDLPYSVYIRASVLDVMCADAIALLPGWENSVGAQLEKHLAEVLGLDILDALDPRRSDQGGVRGSGEGIFSPADQHEGDGCACERADGCPRCGVSVQA